MFLQKTKNKNTQERLCIKSLLDESRRLLEESKSKDISVNTTIDFEHLELKEILANLSTAIINNQEKMRYDIIKFQLANKALETGLWDMEVDKSDPANPNNKFTWSDEFRRMLGFKNEKDFPNLTSSWVDRLHPEDKQNTLNAFVNHMQDRSGKTPYNVEYRCMLKSGEYRWFQAMGETIREPNGDPIRVAGLFLDIHEKKMADEVDRQLREKIKYASGLIEQINKQVHELDETIDKEGESVEESTMATEKIVKSLMQTSEISQKEQHSIKLLLESATQGQASMQETIESIKCISESVDGISDAIRIISGIASNTNLLAMNAAIEAAHAGTAGTGFAVVANEIRKLADNTRENSRNISATLKTIINGIAETTEQSGNTESRITEMSKEISGFSETVSELIKTFNELATESNDLNPYRNG